MDPIERRVLAAKYKELYSLPLKGGGEVLFRFPTRKEMSVYISLSGEPFPTKEIYLFETCVIEESKKNSSFIGDAVQFHNVAIKFMGIGDVEMLIAQLEKQREELNIVDNQFIALIMKAFPGIRESDIDDMTNEQFTRYCAMAELITGHKIEIKLSKKKQSQAQKILNSLPIELPPDGIIGSKHVSGINFEEENQGLSKVMGSGR